MKKVGVLLLLVACLLSGMLLSSCGSSKPCPAYRHLSHVSASVELPQTQAGHVK